MLQSLDGLLSECEAQHGHLCPGQVLGVRMALLGCRLICVEEPRRRDRKKLIVWVEIDRCMTDAISVVTGARLGKRSLKYLDYGKVAATFYNAETTQARRLVALDESRALADKLYPEVASMKERQMLAYRWAADEELFKVENVRVSLKETDMPGRPRTRVSCVLCGEGINDAREVYNGMGERVCKACAFGRYYRRK